MKQLFQNRVWKWNDAGWFGTEIWKNKDWVEIVGGLVCIIGIIVLMYIALIVL